MSGIGHYDQIVAKRAALVGKLSPTARHQAFPRLYRRPMPVSPYVAPSRPKLPPPPPNFIVTSKLVEKPAVLRRSSHIISTALFHHQANLVIQICAKHWEVPPGQIIDHSRLGIYVRPRHASMKLMRELLNMSTSAIGFVIGHRDHTTCVSGIAKAEWLLEDSADFCARYEAAHAELKRAVP